MGDYDLAADNAALLIDLRNEARYIRQLQAEMKQQAAEVKRLRAIVDKLPKTADGVPITAGDIVYSKGGEPRWLSWQMMHYAHMYYSTPEAAEAARAAGGGE